MNNLPILSNAAQVNSKTASSNSCTNKSNDDAAKSVQPFGDVLAQQISDKTKSVNGENVNSQKLLNKTTPDNKPAEKQINDANSNTTIPFSSDQLSPLLPQSASTVAVQMTIPTQATMTFDPQPPELQQHKISLRAIDSSASSMSDAIAQNLKLTAVPIKEDAFAIALNSSSDKVSPKNIEINTQPATLPLMANLSSVGTQATSFVINTPIGQNRWTDEFSQKITWLATSNQDQVAELHLNPPQLGPLDVVLKVSGDQATALFTSQHAAVRDAVELSIPKLREMLAENGIMLGNATVSDQTPRDQRGEFNNKDRVVAPISHELTSTSSQTSTARTTPNSRHQGMVDTFA